MAEGPRLDFYSDGLRRSSQGSGIRKIASVVVPKYLLRQLVFELHMFSIRVRSCTRKRQYRGRTGLKVNIGAGRSGQDGWVNVDGYSSAGINCLYDARRRLPFPDGSAKVIFAEHFFEHIDYTEEAPSFLCECHRVLQPGGVLRIVVPDAEKYLMAYAEGGWEELMRIRPLDDELRDFYHGFTYNTRMELINIVFRQWLEHKFLYDFEAIEFVLTKNGFDEVIRQEFGRSVSAELNIDKQSRAPESLYVEAIK
jgi:predicted SAM-dependent methyltransferase